MRPRSADSSKAACRLRTAVQVSVCAVLVLLSGRMYGQAVSFPSLAQTPVPYDSRSQWQPRPVAAVAFKAGVFAFAGGDEGQTASPNKGDTQQKKSTPQPHSRTATTGSPGHIFWVIPAYKVDYQHGFKPLTTKEKFQEWAQAAYDPLGLGTGAFEAATLEHSSSDGFCGYGGGWVGYGECFGSLELDADISSFIGDFALTVAWHQDPRYFRLGQGSFGRRLWYTVSRVFVTYNDSGRTVFYSSAITGTVAAVAISNLYYPPQDVGVGHTMSRIAIDLGNTALYNAAAEFWPDIHRKLRQVF